MPSHLITSDAKIRSLKPETAPKRLSDGDGLYLLPFFKGGSKHHWRFDYTFGRRRKTLSFGTHPETGLALARKMALEARQMVRAGQDPSAVRKAKRAHEAGEREAAERSKAGLPPIGSFEHVARDWHDRVHVVKTTEGHAATTLRRFERDVFPWIGCRPIAEIEPPEIVTTLRRVEARGAIETAHRIKFACGQVFRYGVGAGYCKRDVTEDLSEALRPVVTRHMAARVKPEDAAPLLRAINGFKGFPTTRVALMLQTLTFQRPGNVRAMRWRDLDLDAAQWEIPAADMKRKKGAKLRSAPHTVPLSTQAVALLKDLQPLTGHHEFVFPSTRGGGRPMSDGTMGAALRQMGFDTRTDHTPHGFRAMARTILVERLGQPAPVIEALLAHAKAGPLGGAYDRATYLDLGRIAMQVWADYVFGLIESRST